MNDASVKTTFDGLKTDLRKCAGTSTHYPGAVLVTSGPDGQVYLTASDGKLMAVAIAESSTPALTELPLPSALAYGTPKNPTRLVLNGEWRREDGKSATILPAITDPGRFPEYGSILPRVNLDKQWVKVRLNLKLLQNLTAAIDTEGIVTLFLPPPSATGPQAGAVEHPLAVLGNQGFGVIMPLAGGSSPAAEADLFNRHAECYRAARTTARQVKSADIPVA